MEKYKARYSEELITANTTIRPDGFATISFEGLGADAATVNNVMPVEQGTVREYNERAYVKIESTFTVTFKNQSNDKRILVLKTYYTED